MDDRSRCYNLQGAIYTFISSGVGNFIAKIGMQLDEEMVEVEITVCGVTSICEGDSASSSSSSSSSSDDNSVPDSTDNYIPVVKRGVKVKNVDSQTFAHGFGIR